MKLCLFSFICNIFDIRRHFSNHLKNDKTGCSCCQVGRAVEGARLKTPGNVEHALTHVKCRSAFWSTIVGVGSNPTPDKNFTVLFLSAFLDTVEVANELKTCTVFGRLRQRVDGVMVSIAAFQAVDLGTIPGQRRTCLFAEERK